MKQFDYYIFIDYSENLIGYNIIKKENIKELLPKISRFRHYKTSKNRKIYLNHIKKTIHRTKIKNYFEKIKIKPMRDNMDIFIEVLEFIKKHDNCIIFVSIDDYQYRKFRKIVNILDCKKTRVVKESSLKKGSPEYQMSLIIDTILNLERRKQ